MNKTTKIILAITIPIGIIVLIIVAFLIYLSVYMKAKDVDFYLQSTDDIQIRENKKYILFENADSNTAFIFYPGAKVDPKAYAQLMYQLALNNIDCFIMKMPFHMAIFNINAADKIIKENNYTNYYLAGHSLGGAMVSRYIKKKYNSNIKGLVLLAAYSDKDLSEKDIKVISIYGSKDGVLSMSKVKDNRKNMPKNYKEEIIEGGNHAQFGSYGEQKRDNKALISRDEQIDITIKLILKIIF